MVGEAGQRLERTTVAATPIAPVAGVVAAVLTGVILVVLIRYDWPPADGTPTVPPQVITEDEDYRGIEGAKLHQCKRGFYAAVDHGLSAWKFPGILRRFTHNLRRYDL